MDTFLLCAGTVRCNTDQSSSLVDFQGIKGAVQTQLVKTGQEAASVRCFLVKKAASAYTLF